VENLPFYGILLAGSGLECALSLLAIVIIGYMGSPLIVWSIAIILLMYGWGLPLVAIVIVTALLLIFIIKPIRTSLVSKPLMGLMKAFDFVPKISATERTALEAGVVWVEGDLFSGKPDFEKICMIFYSVFPTNF
jgi:acyl-CoA dehydrogenase